MEVAAFFAPCHPRAAVLFPPSFFLFCYRSSIFPRVSVMSFVGAILPYPPRVSILITLDEIYDVFAIFRPPSVLRRVVLG
jgi:hypothetical protein